MPITTEAENIDLQIRVLNMSLDFASKREDIAINHCIKAVNRNNQLTADLVRMQWKYYRAAGFPMAYPC